MIMTGMFAILSTMMGASLQNVSVDSAQQQGAQWHCTEPKWAKDVVEDGEFHGTLTSDCTLTGSAGGGLAALDQFLLKDATTDVKAVNGGPYQETFSGLPSVRYDITTEGQGDAGPVTVREDVHVASDLKTRLTRATYSKEIHADGNAGLIREIDVKYDVVPGSTKGSWSAHIENTLHVEKPWYAPEGVFQSEVEKNQISQYKDTVNAVVPEIAKQL